MTVAASDYDAVLQEAFRHFVTNPDAVRAARVQGMLDALDVVEAMGRAKATEAPVRAALSDVSHTLRNMLCKAPYV